jgi:hypothetical protein
MPPSPHRLGLTVEQLINKLSTIEDKTQPVVCHGFGAGSDSDVSAVKKVKECIAGGVLGAYSFEKTKIVWIG